MPWEGPVCLEAWVYLRSYGGGPLLVAAQGYRLEIFRRAGGWSNGHLVFAGPLKGRAWISDRPVPLGRWVHVAGFNVPRPPPARRLVLSVSAPPPARLAIDGADATLPGWGVGDLTLPLGVDPLEDQAADCRRYAFPACRVLAAPPDGQVGAWRLTFCARSLEQVAAGRGQPWRLAPLPHSLTSEKRLIAPSSSAHPAWILAAPGPPGSVIARVRSGVPPSLFRTASAWESASATGGVP